MRRLTEGQITALVADRAAGAEINDLAEKYGVDRTTVIGHLHRAGVSGQRRQGRTLDPGQMRAAGELYTSGVNLAEVGERFNVDRRYLRRVLPAAGFLMRAPGRRPTP